MSASSALGEKSPSLSSPERTVPAVSGAKTVPGTGSRTRGERVWDFRSHSNDGGSLVRTFSHRAAAIFLQRGKSEPRREIPARPNRRRRKAVVLFPQHFRVHRRG